MSASYPPKVAVVLQPAGSKRPEANRPFAAFDQAFCRQLNDVDVVWALPERTYDAFLSGSGIAADRIVVGSQLSAFIDQRQIEKVWLQPLTIFPRAQKAYAPLPATMPSQVGSALVTDRLEASRLIQALKNNRSSQGPTVLVAHGHRSSVIPEMLVRFNQVLSVEWPKAVLTTVEGLPGFGPLSRIEPLIEKKGRVQVVPLMFTAGHHVQVDLLGKQPQSLKSQLGAIPFDCAPPLAYDEIITGLFAKAIRTGLESGEVNR